MLSKSFSEYAMSGTLFIIMQLIVFYNLEGSALYGEVINYILAFQERISFLSEKDTSSLLAALAFVIVFVIGLSLDLLGSMLSIKEMQLFVVELSKHQKWLENFPELSKTYAKEKFQKKLSLKDSFIKRKDVDLVRSVFVSYVLINEGVDKSYLLVEQIRLWRVSRVISLIIWIFFIEIIVFVEFEKVGFSYGTIMIFFTACIATILATASYQRMLRTLFSLLYVTATKEK